MRNKCEVSDNVIDRNPDILLLESEFNNSFTATQLILSGHCITHRFDVLLIVKLTWAPKEGYV